MKSIQELRDAQARTVADLENAPIRIISGVEMRNALESCGVLVPRIIIPHPTPEQMGVDVSKLVKVKH